MVWICFDAGNLAIKFVRAAFDDGDNETPAPVEAGSYVENDGAKNKVARWGTTSALIVYHSKQARPKDVTVDSSIHFQVLFW